MATKQQQSTNNPVQIKKLQDFTGGMVAPLRSGFTQGDTVLEDAYNVLYDEVGRLTVVNNLDSVGALNASSSYLTDIVAWYETGASNPWWIAKDDALDVWTHQGATPDFSSETSVGTWSSDNICFAAMGGKIYLASNGHDTYSWDGTTFSHISDTTADGTGTEFPQADIILQAHDRMFAFNVSEGATPTAYHSRIWFSEAGDAETWLATSWIDVAADDGEEITGAIAFRDEIVVFKESSVYLLTGTDPDSFSLYRVSDIFGLKKTGTTRNRMSAVGVKNVYWVDGNTSRLMLYDGADVRLVVPTLPVDVSGYDDEAVMWYNNSRLYLSSADETYVFDNRYNAWTRLGFGVTMITFVGPKTYMAGVKLGASFSALPFAWYPDSSGSSIWDGSTTYADFTIESGWISLIELATRLRVRYVDFLLAQNVISGNATYKFTLWVNYDDSATNGAAQLSFVWDQSTHASRFRIPTTIDLSSTGPRRIESFKWQITADGTYLSPVSLVGIDIGYTVPPIRQRGDRSVTE